MRVSLFTLGEGGRVSLIFLNKKKLNTVNKKKQNKKTNNMKIKSEK